MKTVIRMACEAGAYSPNNPDDYAFSVKELERFAELVRADEREACAVMAEKEAQYSLAKAIRSRSSERRSKEQQ